MIRPCPQTLLLLQAAACAAAASLLSTAALGQEAAASLPGLDLASLPAWEHLEVLFDEPGDGSLWAVGATYKACFDARGAEFVPFFGSSAPRDFPLRFACESAGLDGAPLAATAPVVRRDGDLVQLDRGAFVEEYALAPDGLEQRFVFHALPRAGELVLRIALETELEPLDLGLTLRFEHELGHVDYGQAFALDAAGRKLALDSTLADGAIELRVPAEFVATAALPLVIDPLVNVFSVEDQFHPSLLPDVAYDAGEDTWAVAYTRVFSALDHDVVVRLLRGDGTSLGDVYIEASALDWRSPRIAGNGFSEQLLVCADVHQPNLVREVRGRLLSLDPPNGGQLFAISPTGGVRRHPDVGGDPFFGTPSYFCVTWERPIDGTRCDIEVQLVSTTGALFGPVTSLTSAGWNELPAISSSYGFANGHGPGAWTVAWQQRFSPTDRDIYAAQLHWDGTVRNPMFPINTSAADDTLPAVSTVLDENPGDTGRPYMVTFQRLTGADQDAYAVVGRNFTVVQPANLSEDFPPQYRDLDQLAPRVDADGERFLVSFVERDAALPSSGDTYVCVYEWSGLTGLAACELHALVDGGPGAAGTSAVHSTAGAGGPPTRFFCAWSSQLGWNPSEVYGALWDACEHPAPGSIACPGDGSQAPCPCGNTGAPGHGCRNGAFASGAQLTGSGPASVSNDALVLTCEQARPSQPGLFFQGDNAINGGQGAWFGDGLRCAGGNVVRIQTRTADAGGLAATTVPIAATGGVAAGDARTYQFWYRDPNLSPCGTGFNLTNGYTIVWLP